MQKNTVKVGIRINRRFSYFSSQRCLAIFLQVNADNFVLTHFLCFRVTRVEHNPTSHVMFSEADRGQSLKLAKVGTRMCTRPFLAIFVYYSFRGEMLL